MVSVTYAGVTYLSQERFVGITLFTSNSTILPEHFDSALLRNYGDRAFCVAVPKLEQYSTQYAECGPEHSFKRLLKTHLFKRAFNI